jgi:predicted TPR repeat methyltransferase
MRTACDFNRLYATPDPWGIAHARFRDRALRRCLAGYVAGKSVLELGCGEEHLTRAVFGGAASVLGIDISGVAIERAKRAGIANARFECRDFLCSSLAGHDVIAAIECLYYLSREEQAAFLDKLKAEHSGPLAISGPIIGGKYFTHAGLMDALTVRGFDLIDQRNIYVRQSGVARPLDLAIRLMGSPALLDWLPDALIHQRCYVARVAPHFVPL